MQIIAGIDLGGTKLALAVFSEDGSLVREEMSMLAGRTEVAAKVAIPVPDDFRK